MDLKPLLAFDPNFLDWSKARLTAMLGTLAHTALRMAETLRAVVDALRDSQPAAGVGASCHKRQQRVQTRGVAGFLRGHQDPEDLTAVAYVPDGTEDRGGASQLQRRNASVLPNVQLCTMLSVTCLPLDWGVSASSWDWTYGV